MKTDKHTFTHSILFSATLVGLLWLVKLGEFATDSSLGFLGVYPRKLEGLIGIITAPLIHGDFEHLISNSFPLLVLAAGVLFFHRNISVQVMLVSWIAPGLWVWVAGRSSHHIGASGLVYALAFFLFFSGIFRKNIRELALSLIVAFLYGSMIWGVFPLKEGVSWESHLFGAIAGIVLAYFYRKQGPPRKKYEWELYDDDAPEDEWGSWNYKKLFPPPEGFKYPEE